MSDPAVVAAVAANARAREAHQLAGHAVAAVWCEGTLTGIHLGFTDWSTSNEANDIPGECEHQTDPEDLPFTAWAGMWAEATWMAATDPDVDDLAEAFDYVWSDGCCANSAAEYEGYVNELTTAAEKLGLPLTSRPWESDWFEELEPLWPAVQEVAELLLGGYPVDHGIVAAIVSAQP